MIRVLILFILLAPLHLHAMEQSARSVFEEANQLFERANTQALVNPSEAQDLYQMAILKYEYLIEKKEIRTVQLYANLGNAYFSAGDQGRAVLNYQRALDIDPLHDDLLHNLQYARSLTTDEVPTTRVQKIRESLTFWHRWPFTVRAGLFGIVHAGLWSLLAVFIYRSGKWVYWSMAATAILSVTFGLSLLTSQQRWDNPVDGVILDREVIARQGNGVIYDNAFTSPLHAGTEFKVLEKRGDWYHAKLLNDDTCWLPVKSVGLVRE